MKRLVVLLALLALAGCGEPDAETAQERMTRLNAGEEVLLVATAPDGTRLWRVYDRDYGVTVYFSSGGTQYRVSHGKSSSDERVQSVAP